MIWELNFKAFVSHFVGSYNYNGDGIANLDYAWIFGAILFLILIICFFRTLRFVFRRFSS